MTSTSSIATADVGVVQVGSIPLMLARARLRILSRLRRGREGGRKGRNRLFPVCYFERLAR
jgi:hypothetical protein